MGVKETKGESISYQYLMNNDNGKGVAILKTEVGIRLSIIYSVGFWSSTSALSVGLSEHIASNLTLWKVLYFCN